MDLYIIAFISCFITAFLGKYVANEKNRSSSEGFILGLLFNLLGVIIVALLPTKQIEKKLDLSNEEIDAYNDNLIKYGLISILLIVPIVIILIFLSS